MYSKQLESLIQSIIADGVITDKERAVLHKKAEAEGIDIDEIDVYLDGLIAQTNNSTKKHDLSLFIKETNDTGIEPVYYKFFKVYLLDELASNEHTVRDIQISFMDVTEAKSSYYKDVYLKRFVGIGLLFSVNTKKVKDPSSTQLTLCFNLNGNDSLFLPLNAPYNYSFQVQNFRNKRADRTWGYQLDIEQLQALCYAKDIRVRFLNNDNPDYIRLTETELPGFQYYAQCFYRAMIDSNAYPDSANNLTEALEKVAQEKREKERLAAAETKRKEKAKNAKAKREAAKVTAEAKRKEEMIAADKVSRLAEKKAEWASADIIGKIEILIKRHSDFFMLFFLFLIMIILILLGF